MEPAGKPKIGRPRGKRSNPDYQQVSAWIRKDTYRDVGKALIDQDRREFSELVQALLETWLRNPKPLDHISTGTRDPQMNRAMDLFQLPHGQPLLWQLQGSSTSQWKPWRATAALRFIPISCRSPFRTTAVKLIGISSEC